MKAPTVFCALVAAVLFGCEAEPRTVDPVATVPELMLSVLEPAAEVYWDAVGTVLDENGTHEIEPRTDEEWQAVVNAAYVIAESGNLLLVQTRTGYQPAWSGMAEALVNVGRQAIQAARARDKAAVFDVGAEVYYVCTACHAAFATETLRPNHEMQGEPE